MTRSEAWKKVRAAVEKGDVEDTLDAIADWLDADRQEEQKATANTLVYDLLTNAMQHCRDAAMDYYVSTK